MGATGHDRTHERASHGHDSPSIRQRLHAATGDREREAEALADRSADEVTVQDAKVAVNRAHGDDPEVIQDDHELASPEDARAVHEEQDDRDDRGDAG
jgi:hypothetical protein